MECENWAVCEKRQKKCIKGRCRGVPTTKKVMGHRAIEFSPKPRVLLRTSHRAHQERIEIDLRGPFWCRGEKNPRATLKKWTAVIKDVYPEAVHCDVVDDYSAAAAIATIRKFVAL